ncbi:hypothetical protein C4D60_Mb06t27730 [Musa balbisiana]|uniref:Uncharacterized protein n=1 Tax=Musa balbisiana TaxID=52838 RepID=A0A4S8IR95_MUSBA|nr:hypothetical protein C4D60_Mb06t27730 [Musa balbisiana]
MIGPRFIRAQETNAQEQEERSFEPSCHATFPRVVMVHPCLPLSLYSKHVGSVSIGLWRHGLQQYPVRKKAFCIRCTNPTLQPQIATMS